MTRDELHAALDAVTVVDAQPPARYGQRHLPRALNLVAEDSDEHVLGTLPDRAAAIVTYSTDAACAARPSSPRGSRRSATRRADLPRGRRGLGRRRVAGRPPAGGPPRPRRPRLRARPPRSSRATPAPASTSPSSWCARRRGAPSSCMSTPTPRPSCCWRAAGAGRGARTCCRARAAGDARRAARHAARLSQHRRCAAPRRVRARARHPAPDVARRRPCLGTTAAACLYRTHVRSARR